MKPYYKTFLFSSIPIFLLVLNSCRHEPEVVQDCVPLDRSIERNAIYIGTIPDKPCFNPNNPEEVLIVFQEQAGLVPKLIVYNLVTHEKTLVYEGPHLFTPSWGTNNWILMNLYDHNVWKIKPDGTGLVKLTSNNCDYYPKWNNDASRFAAEFGSCGLQKTIIYTPEGQTLDTLNFGALGPGSAWNHPLYSASASDMGLKVYDFDLDSIVYRFNKECNSPTGCAFVNDHEVIWAYRDAMFRTNFITNESVLVKSSCDSRLYLRATYHPMSNKVIWQRIDQDIVSESTIEVRSKLFMMNPDGTEEVEIIIEE